MKDNREKLLNVLTAIVLIAYVTLFLFWLSGVKGEKTAEAHSANASGNALTCEKTREDEREAYDVRDAQNGTGRWDELLGLEPTPDHVDQEKVDDEISDHFDLMCDVVFAESGNQGEHGMRLVADVIINRMRCGEAFDDTLNGVLMAPNQFSCVSDGGAARWNGHSMDNVRKICQEELTNVTDPTIFYFRTGHYTPYGVDAYKYRDHYFSRRK